MPAARDGGSGNHRRLLTILAESDERMTAAVLADRLGVSTRSVRSYVTALRAASAPAEVIESSTGGYRLDRQAYSAFTATRRSTGRNDSPRDRLYHLLRRLADARDGLDVFALAEDLFIGDSTLESDLRRLRTEIAGSGVELVRTDSAVRLAGPEAGIRKLLSRMFRDEEAQGFLELTSIEREFGSLDLRRFKTDVIAMLDSHGHFANEFGLDGVLLHVAISVDRAAVNGSHERGPTEDRGGARPSAGTSGDHGLTAEFADLIARHFSVELSPADLRYLGLLLTTRVVTRGLTGTRGDTESIDHELAAVRSIVDRVEEEYLVDLHDEDFILRLALHTHNLLARAKDRSYARNPMTRSIKSSHPMIYELAVFIASELQRREGIEVNDDEISYIALHVGSHLERESRRERRVTCAIVCPNYYDMPLALKRRLEGLLGDELQVETLITRTDVDWDDLETDIVVTTVDPGASAANVVAIQPFITERDVAAIRRAIAGVRRNRRRTRLAEELLVFFDDSLFLRNVEAADQVSMIRTLGERMIDAGVITAEYVDGAIERERMSSTAFTDLLAVPHAMSMTATRTAICIAVNETPMEWAGSRVNVIALIAFSAVDRERFQAVFDQFVGVFTDRTEVQQLVRRGTDLPSFIDEMVRAIDR